MVLYRCLKQGSGNDYSATYTAKVGTTLSKTRAIPISDFYDKSTFNQAVTIGNNVYQVASLLNGCTAFNQSVTIPSSVNSCLSMFNGCTAFNQPVVIPSSVTSCANMFRGCTSLNQNIAPSSSAISCAYMFYGCTGINQTVNMTIPVTTNNTQSMFDGCKNISGNFYIKGTAFRGFDAKFMFNSMNNSKRKNLWFNRVLNNRFNEDGFVLASGITWTAMTNGFYNAGYNIYCYYNYSG